MTVFTALQDVVEDAASYDPYLERPNNVVGGDLTQGTSFCVIPLYHST
jgi:hypothetical protein